MIVRKSRREVERIAESSRIVANTFSMLKDEVKPGVTTARLDQLAEAFIRDHDGYPAFKGYKIEANGKRLVFPASVCASINEEVVHGIPSEHRYLREGDIISIDIGVEKNGYYGDSAWTFAVGDISAEVQHLMDVTQTCLKKAIDVAKAGNRISDIANAVQTHAEDNGCSVVREYVGHGIGKRMHEEPQIPNYLPIRRNPVLRAGYVIAIEPMINLGEAEVDVLEDDWTVVTRDGRWSAHFEHTIAILENETRILTKWNES